MATVLNSRECSFCAIEHFLMATRIRIADASREVVERVVERVLAEIRAAGGRVIASGEALALEMADLGVVWMCWVMYRPATAERDVAA